MQRQGDKFRLFGTYSTAETAQTKKAGPHVLDMSTLSRVSLSHHNYREWVVVCAVRYEPVSESLTGINRAKSQIRAFS